MEIKEKIKTERERLRLTQEALGQKVGVTKTSVSDWETGKAKPRLDNLQALAKIFGKPLAWFSDDEITGAEVQDIQEKERRTERAKLKSLANETKQFLLRSLKAIEEMSRLL